MKTLSVVRCRPDLRQLPTCIFLSQSLVGTNNVEETFPSVLTKCMIFVHLDRDDHIVREHVQETGSPAISFHLHLHGLPMRLPLS